MESEHTQQNQEEPNINLAEFHPTQIDLHATRILREEGYMTIEDPRSPIEIIRAVGKEALLLATLLALKNGEQET